MIGVKFFSHIGNKWKFSTYLLAVVILLVTGIYIYRYEPFRSGFEISDELGGNIFPVTILSTATTDANLILPADTNYLGNPKSCIAVRVKSAYTNSKLRIEVDETPFFHVLYLSLFYPNRERNIWFSRILYGIITLCVKTNRLFQSVFLCI